MLKNIRQIITVISICIIALSTLTSAFAETYTITPQGTSLQKKLWNLDHNYVYSWGIDWSGHADETIVSATLRFSWINNWDMNPNKLHIRLLDNPALGPQIQYYDNENPTDAWDPAYEFRPEYGLAERPIISHFNGNHYYEDSNFENEKVLDAYKNVWTYNPGEYLEFNLHEYPSVLASLNTFAADGVFGFGFDPDCHYYNSGVELLIETASVNRVVPEPISIMLGALGLGVIGIKRRIRR